MQSHNRISNYVNIYIMSTDITDLCDIEFYRVHYSNVIYSIMRAGSLSRCNKILEVEDE